MHMSDALISPAVGGTVWVASAAAVAYCSKKLKEEQNPRLPALMGTMGAFIFAAQMINFAIPGTGSSGHIGGGLLLAAVLGPYAAFLTIASVLIVQALFFADGGLLALGCNIFNLGVFPCFVAFPLIYKTILGSSSSPDMLSRTRIIWSSLLACIVGLQLGSLGVVIETRLSGISDLPFSAFLLAMQPIHLAIGIVEGLATAAVLLFLHEMQPSLLRTKSPSIEGGNSSLKPVIISLVALSIVTAGFFSWHASSQPDGLEWAIEKTAGTEELQTPETSMHEKLGALGDKTALFPDYNFASAEEENSPAYGTSIAGIAGGGITLILALLIGLGFRRKDNTASLPQ